MKHRVCAAIIRAEEILMVRHVEGERTYWTLPGGGVEEGESDEQAIIREVREETGLEARVVRFLWDEAMSGNYSVCRCFLMQIDEDAIAVLGFDPEEAHLPIHARMLQDVTWHSLDSMKNDGQVSRVMAAL